MINGGTVVALGGMMEQQPDAAGKQKSIIVNNLKINKGDKLVAKDANGKEIIAIASPRTFSESSICISATGIATVEKAE